MTLAELTIECLKENARNDDSNVTVANLLDGTLAATVDYATEVNNVLLSINRAFARLQTAGKVSLKSVELTADPDVDVYDLSSLGDVRAIRSVFIMSDGVPVWLGWSLITKTQLYLGYDLEDTIHVVYERRVPTFTESDWSDETDLSEYGISDEACHYVAYFAKSELFEDRDPDRCKRYLNYFEQFVSEINEREPYPHQRVVRSPHRPR